MPPRSLVSALLSFAFCGSAAIAATLPASARDLVYVQDGTSGTIVGFDAFDGRRAATLPYPFRPVGLAYGGGSGLAYDTSGALIAAFTDSAIGRSGMTALFAYASPGATAPTLLRKSADVRVGQIAVSPAREVANSLTAIDVGFAGVEFLATATAAHGRFVGVPGPVGSLAYAHDGTLVIDGTANGVPYLGTIARGARAVTPLVLAGAPPIAGPVTIDRAGNLALFTGDGVTMYGPRGAELAHVGLTRIADPTAVVSQIAISHDERRLYAIANAHGGSYLIGYDLASGGGSPKMTVALPNAYVASIALNF